VSLVQALRPSTGSTTHKGSRFNAIIFFLSRHQKRVRGQSYTPAKFYPWERPGTHCTGGWVGPRAGLDKCGKYSPSPGFDPQTVQPVATRYNE